MRKLPALALAAGFALSLSGCGGGGGGGSFVVNPTPTNARGTAVSLPPAEVVRLSAGDLSTLLSATSNGKTLKALAGDPICGVDLRYLEYNTVGGQNEAVNATAAVMVPSGTDPRCNGARPIVLYGHGTATDRNYNIANWVDPNQAAAAEGAIVATFYAAQGFIVVAPNYAGYDKSTLSYHPYLNGTQQGKDMADALSAARSALPGLSISDSGVLFVTGYSQGGYTAIAAQRELQATGKTVTAVAPLSAPSAISLLVDYTFSGWPALGATVFTPFLTTSWQKQFGNVYTATGDIYEAQYATGIDTLLPSLTPSTLFTSGKLPQLALFPANAVPGPVDPSLSIFYASNNLIRQSFLTQVANDIAAAPCPGNALPATTASLGTAAPMNCKPLGGMRQAAVANDLRNFLPQEPTLMCGGANDPTVNFLSTRATAGYFLANGMAPTSLTVVDLEAISQSDSFSTLRAGFQQAKVQAAQAAGSDPTAQQQAISQQYHGTLVPPFCMAAAQGFFKTVLTAVGGA